MTYPSVSLSVSIGIILGAAFKWLQRAQRAMPGLGPSRSGRNGKAGICKICWFSILCNEREREGERREKKTQTERSKAKRKKTGILHLRCAGVSKMLHQSVTLHLFTSACRSSRNFWRPIAFLYSKSSATTDVQRLSKTLLCPQQYCMMPKLACGSCAPSYPTKRHAEFVRMWEWCFG